MKSHLTCVLLLLAYAFTYAQSNATLRGVVQDDAGNPLAYANIILHAAADSAMVKAEYSSEKGDFKVAGIRPEAYFLEISYVGLPAYFSDVFTLAAGEEKNLPTITLQAAPAELSTVTVTAQKPIVEVHPDKTVFNVEGSVNAVGNDGLELLRKAPGVVVDNNDNIMLQGKSGVRIFIDGKPSPLTAADLANFLRSMQSSDIEAIEIITNPSARFEAEGNAGIINIRMKKNKNFGTNGTVEAGYSQALHARMNASLGLNHRNKAMNVFGKYSLFRGENQSFNNFLREQSNTYFEQRSRGLGKNTYHNFRAGADFFLSDNSTIGVLASGYVGDGSWTNRSRTAISMLNGPVQTILTAQSINNNDRFNGNLNVNYRFDNKKGRVWNIDADYARFRFDADAYQPNQYLQPDGVTLIEERIFGNVAPTDIDLVSFKIDREQPLLGGQLSVGVKSSLVATNNSFDFYNYVDGDQILDAERSNDFAYEENINAAYAQYSRPLNEKVSVQAGLRVEHTHSMGELTSQQQTGNDLVERDYVNVFPSGGISWQVNPKNSLRLTYSYRIDRPRYQDLNPFEWKLDELTFQKGNPFLQPQYTHNIELGHTFNYRYTTSIGYAYTTDLMTQITDTASNMRAFITQLNLAQQRHISLNFSAPFSLAKWWNVYANASFFRVANKGIFEEGKTVDLTRFSFNTYMQHTFTLPLGLMLEVSGFYNSPSIWGGNFRSQAMWGMDTGVSTKFLNDKLRLKVSVNDLFYTQQWRGVNEFGDLKMDASGGWESRRLNVNLTYNFGNENVKSRRRQTGLEDESKRAGGNNN